MIQTHLKFNLSYALVFILVLVGGFKQWTLLSDFSIPAITLVLLLFLYISTKLKGRFHRRLFKGLIFAFIGDTLIQLKSHNPSYFIYGLIVFLICLLFYISAFYLDFRSAQELDKKGAKIAIGSYAVGSIVFYFYLRPYLGIYKLPVMIYIFVLALVAMMAVFRNQRVNTISFNLVFAGTLFFILSNFFLAYDHFIYPFQFSNLLVITTYMIAQYLIVLGGIKRKLLNNEPA